MRLYAYVMPLCFLLMILQRVVVLLCCGLSFGIAMPAYAGIAICGDMNINYLNYNNRRQQLDKLLLHSPAYEDGTDSEFRNVGN